MRALAFQMVQKTAFCVVTAAFVTKFWIKRLGSLVIHFVSDKNHCSIVAKFQSNFRVERYSKITLRMYFFKDIVEKHF